MLAMYLIKSCVLYVFDENHKANKYSSLIFEIENILQRFSSQSFLCKIPLLSVVKTLERLPFCYIYYKTQQFFAFIFQNLFRNQNELLVYKIAFPKFTWKHLFVQFMVQVSSSTKLYLFKELHKQKIDVGLFKKMQLLSIKNDFPCGRNAAFDQTTQYHS